MDDTAKKFEDTVSALITGIDKATENDKKGIPLGYKTPINVSPRVRIAQIGLLNISRTAFQLGQHLQADSFIDGVEFAVAEINARHGTNYTLDEKPVEEDIKNGEG